MEHLRSIGEVVYLKLPYEEVAERLGDLNARGVTLQPGQTIRIYFEDDQFDENTFVVKPYKMLRDTVFLY